MGDAYVVAYEHIDLVHAADLVIPASRASDLLDELLLPCNEENARLAFEQAGWEGDGSLGIIWLPPFVFVGADGVTNECECLWHVKQGNNGTSWLVARHPFEFPFLGEGDKKWKAVQLQADGRTEHSTS